MTAPHPLASFASLPFSVRLSAVLLALLTATLTVLLWPHWLHNADLSHGLFMPVIFLLLLRESRAGTFRFLDADRSPRIDRPEPALRAGGEPVESTSGSVERALTTFALVVLLFAGLISLAAGGLYAASLGWSHDLVAFTLTVALALLLAAGLVVFSRNSIRLLPFNWSAIVAIGLWVLCAPLPPGTYTRLTLGLQLMVTENVLRALHLLGIGAVRHGNILELASASVGIEEACSGVRSLISCIFAGFFFSASLVRRPWSRVLLIALSAPLALLMNFIRSLTLTLLANSGVHIAGPWHDLTGFGVLAVTAALLVGLALVLERKAGAVSDQPSAVSSGTGLPTRDFRGFPLTESPEPQHSHSANGPTTTSPITGQETRATSGARLSSPRLLVSALTVAVALCVVFYANTHPAQHRDAPVPNLAAVLPLTADGWSVETANDLYQFSDTLQTDHLAQRTYSRMTDRGVEQITVYLAYWRPGQASVSLVASHTPDACWPGSGWDSVPVPDPRVRLAVGNLNLPVAEARSFQSGDFPQNVWFWHLYDGRPITQETPNSPAQLLRIAWHYGFRHDGDQLFIRVSSNRNWTDISNEPLLETVFARLRPLGL